MRSFLMLAALGFFLAGCASVPMADHAADTAAKKFKPSPGTAGLYIYRNEYRGGAVKMLVVVDGRSLGKTVPMSYLYTEVPPGRHIITADGGNTDQIKIEAIAGESIYVHQAIKSGFSMAGSSMAKVSDTEGQAGVLECQMISSQF